MDRWMALCLSREQVSRRDREDRKTVKETVEKARAESESWEKQDTDQTRVKYDYFDPAEISL